MESDIIKIFPEIIAIYKLPHDKTEEDFLKKIDLTEVDSSLIEELGGKDCFISKNLYVLEKNKLLSKISIFMERRVIKNIDCLTYVSPEIPKLMNMIIHNFYSSKDIFIRELISNASDAIDKLKIQSLSNPNYLESNTNFDIKIKPQPGMLILFPSNFAYTHIAHPVTSGSKYALVTWIKDRDY